jgi:hypothetical protein
MLNKKLSQAMRHIGQARQDRRQAESETMTTKETLALEPAPRLAVTRKSVLVCVLFFMLVPTVAHWQFSWMGFTPTDEGYVLMTSRRLLAGQVPHRDFITNKPTLSPLLHMPEVALGGDYTFWISRFVVWLQFAVLGWAWAELLISLLLPRRDPLYVAAFALLAFLFSSNTFPPIAWHTIDGLFLLSLGLLLRIRLPRFTFPAYFLIGAAYLCKQSFAFAFIAVLIALGDWRRLRYWLAALLPVIIYCGFFISVGGLPDAVAQLTAQRGVVDPGIRSYVHNPLVAWGVLAGVGLGWLLGLGRVVQSTVALWLASVGISICALELMRGMYRFGDVSGYSLFGVALGLVVSSLARGKSVAVVRAGLLALTAAWCVALSMGFNSPNLAAGPLVCFILVAVIAGTIPRISNRRVGQAVIILIAVSLSSFAVARRHWIYRDAPATKLTGKLDGVFPGAKSIQTNANTLEYLEDLQVAIGKVHGKRYTILPDTAGYWVKAGQLNPISIDWPNWTELGNDKLLHRAERDLGQEKGRLTILMEKVAVEDLATEFHPLLEKHYPILPYVHEHFQKVDETKFFDILE